MTEEGLLILRAEEDNRKNKRIYLTEKGKETVERIVVPLMDAERRALAAIGEQEAEILLKTMKKHNYEKTYGIFPRRNRGTDKTRGSRVIAGTSDDDTKTMPA